MSRVSPVGFDVGETHEALIRLRKLGFTTVDLNRIAESDEIAQKVVDALRGEAYPLTVDYSLTLEQMIEAGRYDWVNSDITAERFPIEGTGQVRLEGQLVYYGKSMSSEAVLTDMDQRGLRPATGAELLAFGEKYPELQRQFPIVELAASAEVRGGRCVLDLGGDDRRRYLYLGWFDGGWGGGCRFLAFRK